VREEAQIDTDGSRKEGEGSKRTVRREEGDQRACKGSRRGGRSSPGRRAWSSVRRSGSVVGTQGAHRTEMRGAAKASLRAQRKRNEIYSNSEVIVLLSKEHKVSFFLLEDGYIGVYDVNS